MNKPRIFVFCTVTGSILITAAVVLLAMRFMNIPRLPESSEVTEAIGSILPSDRQNGIPEERAVSAMPVYIYKGNEYIGLLSADGYGAEFPVLSVWDERTAYVFPCRYDGSASDGTLSVGGGSVWFAEKVEPGDIIRFTDVKGTEYRYTVTAVKHTKDLPAAAQTDDGCDFVIFCKNSKTTGYVRVRCTIG